MTSIRLRFVSGLQRLGYGFLAAVAATGWTGVEAVRADGWNQWLGSPGRTLAVTNGFEVGRVPVFVEGWRVPLGSGVAGVSIVGTNAVTGVTDGRQDAVVMLDSGTGVERWRVALGRTKKRGEGTPLGPLSTPALDDESTYMQALDGRLLCVENATGKVRWEVNVKREFKAFEPGYGFASSPLLVGELVVVMPAGSSTASVAALDRRTGAVRWTTALGSGTEYASATLAGVGERMQVVAHVGTSMAGISPKDGHRIWKTDDVGGGLWTASVLSDGRVYFPLATETQVVALDGSGARKVWGSPVFGGIMGPVVEVAGLLVGHHQRKLTALDAMTGEQVWQLENESDGQLLALGPWLVFVNDRAGELMLFSVGRSGAEVKHRQRLMKPTRMETPLAFAAGTLFVRTTTELIALRVQ